MVAAYCVGSQAAIPVAKALAVDDGRELNRLMTEKGTNCVDRRRFGLPRVLGKMIGLADVPRVILRTKGTVREIVFVKVALPTGMAITWKSRVISIQGVKV